MPIKTGLPQHVVSEIIERIPIEYRSRDEVNAALRRRAASQQPKAKRMSVPTIQLVRMYTEEHKTLDQIGFKVGLTGAAIAKRLKTAGITRQMGEWLTRECGFCGNRIRINRARARCSERNYCNESCHYAALENPGYKPWRQGQRLARAIVSQYFSIPEGAVVHHKDGDDRNNDKANLAVYAGNGDHVRAHRTSKPVAVLWDGANV